MPHDLVCLSHLRWDFVFQRPNHLMTRAARDRRVFFVEEPVFDEDDGARAHAASAPVIGGAVAGRLESRTHDGVVVVTPHLPPGLSPRHVDTALAGLLDGLVETARIVDPVVWYYTPFAVAWAGHLAAAAVVYDCMDELSAFRGAPLELVAREAALLVQADVVFTGGNRLYEAKRGSNANTHAFPSSVDVAHFSQARLPQPDPADQAPIPHPRLGFFGVLDERLDLGLIDGVAALRPDWHLVFVGPVAKIDPATLPGRDNITYLGQRSYADLPCYLSGWDVAMMPFARNAATEFISPTKTPEYLAGGRPVVSTSIHDVVAGYASRGLVRIADTPGDFVAAAEAAMVEDREWRWRTADAVLAGTSWDATWERMASLVDEAIPRRRHAGSVVGRRSVTPRVATPAGRRSERESARLADSMLRSAGVE